LDEEVKGMRKVREARTARITLKEMQELRNELESNNL
jgi:hypothetical protein